MSKTYTCRYNKCNFYHVLSSIIFLTPESLLTADAGHKTGALGAESSHRAFPLICSQYFGDVTAASLLVEVKAQLTAPTERQRNRLPDPAVLFQEVFNVCCAPLV